ncbi:DUF397 domain-containing protein [Actinoallomurus iriomotensis]
MDKQIARDGWRKSTRSGGNNPECVEVKVVQQST